MLRLILSKLGFGVVREQEAKEAEEAASAGVQAKPLTPGALPGPGPRLSGLKDAVMAGWYNNATSELMTGFPIAPEDIVLDVGCGEGGATLFSARQGAYVVFSDLDRDKVEQLAEQVAQTDARGFKALVGDTNPLPLADNYASRIIAIEMLEHTDSPLKILQELARVGQPGALYLITVPDPVAEKLQRGIAPPEYFQAPNHVHIFERDEFEDTVKAAGLEVVHRTSYSFYWSMYMFLFWVTEDAEGRDFDGAILDRIKPPYHPLLQSWASTWQQLLALPRGPELKKILDEFMPKAQVIIARKPL